jgi:ribosomal-protein-serine acetyltransferase
MELYRYTPPRIISVAQDLELHPVTELHADALYPLVQANRDRLREWLPWLHDNYSLRDMRQHLADRQKDNYARVSFTAAIQAGGTICGAIGLHQIDRAHRNTSIGYWLAADFEGKGIMTSACRALVTEAFQSYGIHRVEIRCATSNAKSCAIPKRLGFNEEGTLRQAEWLYDHWVDLRVFAMLEQNW